MEVARCRATLGLDAKPSAGLTVAPMRRESAAHPLLPLGHAAEPSAEAASPAAWMAALRERTGRTVEVDFGRSRTRPVVLTRRGLAWRLRLHAFFAQASANVVDALGAWLIRGRADRAATRCLDVFIAARLETLGPAPPPASTPTTCPAAGVAHDLDALAADLRDDPGLADLDQWPTLTWARRGPRPRRSLQLGLFVPESRTVRIHPILDRADVPAWFVRAILFHELLHAALPPRLEASGRWRKHDAAFRARERAYRDHARAEAWLAANIARLLRLARKRPPVGG